MEERCVYVRTLIVVLLSVGLACGFQLDMTRTINFTSNEGKVVVYDAAMPEWLTSNLYTFLQPGNRWNFQYPDEHTGISPRENNNMHWVSPISPNFFMKSKPWIVLKRLAEDFTGMKGNLAYRVTGTMLRRGASPVLVPGTNSGDVYFRIFLTASEDMKDLSQLLFFDKNDEIIQAVQPKFNRIVAWNSSLAYMYKPVDFDNFNLEYSILIKISRDAEKVQDELKYIKNLREEEAKQGLTPFPFENVTGGPFSREYYEAHCTRKFYDKRGGVISIFDDLLNENELRTLTRYLVKYNTGYSGAAYQTKEDDDADNVSWIVALSPENIYTSKILEVVKGMAFYLSGEDNWHPYDVSLNMVQNTFHTRIHEDCEDYEFEYTFLLYLNPNWTENMYGETIFLNQIKEMKRDRKGNVIQDKDYETIVAVRPKYGRIAMFRNNIPHSARPPSPDFHGTRYTFAVKVSRNKQIALTKTLRETLEFKQEAQDEGAALYETVAHMAATYNFTMTEKEIASNLTKYREEKNKGTEEEAMKLQKSLIRRIYLGKDEPSV